MISHEHVGIPGLGFQDVPSQAHRSHGRAAAAPAEPWLASCQVPGREATDTTWGERPELGRCHVTFETQNAWPLGWVGENEIWMFRMFMMFMEVVQLGAFDNFCGFSRLPHKSHKTHLRWGQPHLQSQWARWGVSRMRQTRNHFGPPMERNLFGQFPPVSLWLAFTERPRSGIISMFPYVSRFLFLEDLGRFENPVGSDFSLVLRCFKPPNPTTMGVFENGYWHDLTWLAVRKFNEKPIRLYVLQRNTHTLSSLILLNVPNLCVSTVLHPQKSIFEPRIYGEIPKKSKNSMDHHGSIAQILWEVRPRWRRQDPIACHTATMAPRPAPAALAAARWRPRRPARRRPRRFGCGNSSCCRSWWRAVGKWRSWAWPDFAKHSPIKRGKTWTILGRVFFWVSHFCLRGLFSDSAVSTALWLHYMLREFPAQPGSPRLLDHVGPNHQLVHVAFWFMSVTWKSQFFVGTP